MQSTSKRKRGQQADAAAAGAGGSSALPTPAESPDTQGPRRKSARFAVPAFLLHKRPSPVYVRESETHARPPPMHVEASISWSADRREFTIAAPIRDGPGRRSGANNGARPAGKPFATTKTTTRPAATARGRRNFAAAIAAAADRSAPRASETSAKNVFKHPSGFDVNRCAAIPSLRLPHTHHTLLGQDEMLVTEEYMEQRHAAEWIPQEAEALELALRKFGRDFHKVKAMIPSRAISEIISYYYRNKHKLRYTRIREYEAAQKAEVAEYTRYVNAVQRSLDTQLRQFKAMVRPRKLPVRLVPARA